MWAGRRTGKGKRSTRPGRENQADPIERSSSRNRYGPDPRISIQALWPVNRRNREAGHTTAPDRMHQAVRKMLASTGASTHDVHPATQAPAQHGNHQGDPHVAAEMQRMAGADEDQPDHCVDRQLVDPVDRNIGGPGHHVQQDQTDEGGDESDQQHSLQTCQMIGKPGQHEPIRPWCPRGAGTGKVRSRRRKGRGRPAPPP